MAPVHQPLIDTPKPSHRKDLYLALSLAVLLSLAAVITTRFTKVIIFSNPPVLHNICDHAHDEQASCLAIVSEIASNSAIKMNHDNLLQVFLKKSISHTQNTIEKVNDVSCRINDPREQAALVDCVELMELSMDRIKDSITALEGITVNSHSNAHAWLSGVLTNHDTCLDGLTGPTKSTLEPELKDLIMRARISLSMLVAISPLKDNVILSFKGDFPSWVTSRDRKLLQGLPKNIKANVVVAKDGSGKYKTVEEAVASAPNNGKNRYVIYVKKGTYKENVEVGKAKKNVMIVGDGMDSTIITGSLNVVDGSTTFKSATVGKIPFLFKYILIITCKLLTC